MSPASASKNNFNINQYTTETHMIKIQKYRSVCLSSVRIHNLINEGSLQNNSSLNKFNLKYICKFAMKILAAPWCLTHFWWAATPGPLVWIYNCLTPFIKARTTNILAKNSFQIRNKVQIVTTFNSSATKYSRKTPRCTKKCSLVNSCLILSGMIPHAWAIVPVNKTIKRKNFYYQP